MCLAIPGQIVRILPDANDLATVDVSGVTRNINIGLLESEQLKPGDWVLIHVGFAMSKVDEAEARSSLEFLETLGQAWRDEMQALEQSAAEAAFGAADEAPVLEPSSGEEARAAPARAPSPGDAALEAPLGAPSPGAASQHRAAREKESR